MYWWQKKNLFYFHLIEQYNKPDIDWLMFNANFSSILAITWRQIICSMLIHNVTVLFWYYAWKIHNLIWYWLLKSYSAVTNYTIKQLKKYVEEDIGFNNTILSKLMVKLIHTISRLHHCNVAAGPWYTLRTNDILNI